MLDIKVVGFLFIYFYIKWLYCPFVVVDVV